MLIPPEEGLIQEVIYSDNNIIISDSTLRKILPPQLNKMTAQYKLMCDCKCCISSKSMYSSLLTWRDRRLKHLRDISRTAQNRRSSEMSSHIFETYKIQYDLIAFIFTIPPQTWPWKKRVPVIINIMGYHTVNFCYIVVISAQVFP